MDDVIAHFHEDDGWHFAIVVPDTGEPLARSTHAFATREDSEAGAEAMLDVIRAWGC